MGESMKGHASAAKDMVTETPGVMESIGKFILGTTAVMGKIANWFGNLAAHVVSIPLKVSNWYLNSDSLPAKLLGGGKTGRILTAATIGAGVLYGVYKLAGVFGKKSEAEVALDREQAASDMLDAQAKSIMLDRKSQQMMSGGQPDMYDRVGRWSESAPAPRQGGYVQAEQAAVTTGPRRP